MVRKVRSHQFEVLTTLKRGNFSAILEARLWLDLDVRLKFTLGRLKTKLEVLREYVVDFSVNMLI